MFRRNNIDSKNNGQPADEKVREEDRAEQEIRQKVGNQAAGSMPPLLPQNIGNEAMNNIISGDENPVQNVIRKGLDISDEINPNDIRLIRDSLKQNDSDSSDEEDLKIDKSKNKLRNAKAPANTAAKALSPTVMNGICFSTVFTL